MGPLIDPFLDNEFMQRALIAGCLVALACAVVGTFVVLRGLAFIGDALAHGVLPGIAIAVALSIGNVFRRAWWPYQTVLGRVPGLRGFHDVRSYPEAELLPQLVIFRFDAPLFFANSRTFREQVRALAAAEPRPAWIVDLGGVAYFSARDDPAPRCRAPFVSR